MPIYNNNWKSYAMYTVCTVESGANYGAIENYAYAGVGIAQWTYDRSWQLLNLMVTDYPSTLSLFPILGGQIQPGTSSWGQRVFTQAESNEISNALVTTEGVATQDKLWNKDCDERYIPLLKDQCHLTDPKTAIFALSVHHQAPNAFWQIYNACGNCDVNTWYNTTLNNGIVGSYRNRQDTVKSLLDQWDGESGAEGFGNYDPSNSTGGNQNPGNGNPDNTYEEILAKIQIKTIRKVGKELSLQLSIAGHKNSVLFYRQANGNLWIPKNGLKEIDIPTEDTEVPTYPGTGTGTESQRNTLVQTIQSFLNQLEYSQAQGQRMNPPGGFADCSGLCWYCYQQIGVEIGTWTGTQCQSGTQIKTGSGVLDTTGILKGDLIFMNWSWHNPQYDHVGMYCGGDLFIDHGGNPYIGPVERSASQYMQYAYDWEVRRYI